MRTYISQIGFYDFRNYHEFHLTPNKELTIIIGDNAVGKTNIIEGIQYLTMGESFRKPNCEEVIHWGSQEARISLTLEKEKTSSEIALTFSQNKTLFINGNKRRTSSLRGYMPAVLFTPDDLNLMKGPAEKRRSMIDDVGIQLSESYRRLKKDYEKIVRQRNNLLKEENVNEALLDSWNDSLTLIGAKFYKHRINLFELIKKEFIDIYTQLLSDEKVSVSYLPSWQEDDKDVETSMKEALLSIKKEEKARRITLIGPHRDEIKFMIDGKDARLYGSQGQQRTLVLAWKLAEVEVIEHIFGNPPVLLLDDVMSELDENRRLKLLSYVKANVQTFITTTNSGYFSKEVLESATLVSFERPRSFSEGEMDE